MANNENSDSAPTGKNKKIQVILGWDPDLAGDGFTVNGMASFDLFGAISFACDVLKHQGAPITNEDAVQFRAPWKKKLGL